MNTFERHRQYRLRRHRFMLLRRRVLAIATVTAVTLGAWTLLARWSPPALAPPDPARITTEAAREFVHTAARSVNTVHARLRPDMRDDAKIAALLLFSEGVPDTADPDEQASPVSDDAVSRPAEAGMQAQRMMDVLLIGLDSRLGNARGRADAIHLLTLNLDAPSVQITSIPRGTWSDLGYAQEASNILANVRAARGREELLRRIARLCRRDSVPYYLEIGFSDAFGILELLGFEDPSAELQALRHRKDYQFGDHNRCYNQGLFVRSAMLRLLPMLEGVTGEVLMRAGKDLVETNLTLEQCRGVVYLLNDAEVDALPSRVTVTLRSRFRRHIEVDVLPSDYAHSVRNIDYREMGGAGTRAEQRIRLALREARAAESDGKQFHERVRTLFRQHAWYQISDHETRRLLRDSLAQHLFAITRQTGSREDIERIRRTLKADDILFPPPVSENRHSAKLHGEE